MPLSQEDRVLGLLFLLPAIIVIGLVIGYPMIKTFIFSFTSFSLLTGLSSVEFVGLSNYIDIFRDPLFLASLKNTFVFVFLSLFLQLVVGGGIALLLTKEFRGKRLTRTIVSIPMMITPVAIGLTWKFMFNGDIGIINYLLGFTGFPKHSWLGDRSTSLFSVTMVQTWMELPFVILVLNASLQSFAKEPYEAAAIDGASPWQTFWYITVPMLKPMLIIVLILQVIDMFSRAFDLVYVLTGGGPGNSSEILIFTIYKTGFKFFKVAYASAMAYFLVAMILLICVYLIKYLHRLELERM